MIRAAAVLLLCLLATPAGAFERFGVIAVADPPAGPDADLAELAHQLRAACRDRIGGVEDVPTMRARLLGQTSNATLSELDRAYGGALAVFQNGEFESALRTLHAIVEDLESLPETDDSYSQWVRAQLRLAHAALTLGRDAEAESAFYALAKTDAGITAEPDQFSPSYRRRFDGIKAKVRALQARRLTVTSQGRPGTVFVNGRTMGTTPLSLWLPAGSYRIGGAAEELRVPSFRVDLRSEDRGVVLDFALAESLRVNAGPGLALAPESRGDGIVRAGAWLGVDRVITVSRVFEGQAAFLLGSIYDVRRGALMREGSVRMVAGSVPAANLGALAAFLLTGQSSRDVKDRTEEARDRAPPVVARGVPVAPPPPAVAAAPATPPAPPIAAPAPAATSPQTSPQAAAPAALADSRPAPAAAANAAPVAPSAPAPAAPKRTEAVAKPAAVAPAAAAAKPPPATASPKVAPPRSEPARSAARTSPAASAGAATPTPAPDAAASAPAAAATPVAEKPSLAAIPPPAREEVPLAASLESKPPARRWMRPAAIGAGVVAGTFAALAVQQALSARSAYSDADAMLQGDVFAPGADPGRYRDLQRDGDGAKRNAYLSAGVAAAFAATAGVLGWKSMERPGEPVVALRF